MVGFGAAEDALVKKLLNLFWAAASMLDKLSNAHPCCQSFLGLATIDSTHYAYDFITVAFTSFGNNFENVRLSNSKYTSSSVPLTLKNLMLFICSVIQECLRMRNSSGGCGQGSIVGRYFGIFYFRKLLQKRRKIGQRAVRNFPEKRRVAASI